MSTLPCKDCICLPICRNQYISIMNENPPFYYRSRETLQNKCSVLSRYIDKPNHHSIAKVTEQINILHEFMTGESI